MALTVHGRIEPSTAGVDHLAGCRVEVTFDLKPKAADLEESDTTLDTTPGQGRVTTRTDSTGHFTLDIPDDPPRAGTSLRFVVSGPAGQTIGSVSREEANAKSVVIPVSMSDVAPIPLTPPANVPKPATRRVAGMVIGRAGRTVPANSQVLVLARKTGDPGGPAALAPILAARTDAAGNFFGDAPNETYERASALVEGISEEIPIRLAQGALPAKILLVANVPPSLETADPESHKDCSCDTSVTPRTPSHADIENAPDTYSADLGTGRCVQFNTPNRAIEEFDFYTVVRTTEPEIVGFLLTGDVSDAPNPDDPLETIGPAAEADAAAQSAKATAAAAARDASAKEAAAVSAQAAADAIQAALDTPKVKQTAKQILYDRRGGDFSPGLAIVLLTNAMTDVGLDPPKATSTAKALMTALGSVSLNIVFSNDDNLVTQTVQGVLDTVASTVVAAAAAARTAADAANARSASAADAAASAARTAADADEAKKAELADRAQALEDAARAQLELSKLRKKPLGRQDLNRDNPVDWDETPTFYQAADIAHGHLLHFKQVWYADGYSLGDLLYSLPLAPGQKKLISVVDWERREQTNRAERTFSDESVNAVLARDRDLGEVVNGALTESARGGSKSTTAGVGAGTGAAANGTYQGVNFGALVGVSGGYGQADASAWQDSARDLSAGSLQNLRDVTMQSASAVRGLRSSVVQAVSQGEAARATTEVVANHNHCHAMTVQYFEVLRHLKLVHELADVQECLFVPLPMDAFDLAKALRWRQPLQTYLQRPELAPAFDAAKRVRTNWRLVDVPVGRYADERIRSIAGELLLTVMIPLPPFPDRPKPKPPDPADVGKDALNAVNPTDGVWGVLLAIGSGGASLVAGKATEAAMNLSKAAAQGIKGVVDDFYAQPTPQERYDKFQQEIMPGIVEAFVDQLELWAVTGSNEVHVQSADFTLVSTYQPGIPLLVSLRANLSGQLSRGDVTQLIIRSSTGMPTGCRAIVNAATIRYRTSSFEHALVDDNRVNDDIDPPKVTGAFSAAGDFSLKPLTPGGGASLDTPLDEWEQRNPRTDDRRLSAELVDHLNDNLEFYHHAIWWTMDPNRRYMLLDGYYAPGSGHRSVASVVDNRLIGIVGNSFVMPVAAGVHLDPRFVTDAKGKRANLLDFYAPDPPVAAARVSLPTRGVFAEAVMGSCNSCEEIDDSKFWRWDEAPIDEPPAIDSASTASRRSDPAVVTPTPFPTPIVSIQNAPAEPAPAGVGGVLTALGKPSFTDITGLAGTQANAAAAYSQALDTAYKFGKEASTLAQQAAMLGSKDKAMGAIDKAQAAGQIDANEAKQLRVSALKKMVGDATTDSKAASVGDRLKVIDDQAAKGSITPERAAELRDQVLQGLNPEGAQQSEEQKATTETIRSLPVGTVESIETTDPSGATTKITAQPTSTSDSAELSAAVAAAVAQLGDSPFYSTETSAQAVKRLQAIFPQPAKPSSTAFVQEVQRLGPAKAERAPMRYAVVVTGPTPSPIAGSRMDQMITIASMAKLAMMYAAYQLRADVEVILTNSGIGTDGDPKYTQAATDAVAAAFAASSDPGLKTIGRTPAIMPVLERIFDIQAFLAYDKADRPGKLKFRSGTPTTAGDEDSGTFAERLDQAIKHSDNDSATTCIADIGLPYIKALLTRSGLADVSGPGKGLWLATTFGYNGQTWPTRTKDRSVTKGIEERACEVEGSFNGSGTTGEGGTARAVATFYRLLQDSKLVDYRSSTEMQALLEHPATSAYLVEGLAAGGTVRVAESKIGILGNRFHDGALLISDPPAPAGGPAPTTPRRSWIVVVLDSINSAPIKNFAPDAEQAVEHFFVALPND